MSKKKNMEESDYCEGYDELEDRSLCTKPGSSDEEFEQTRPLSSMKTLVDGAKSAVSSVTSKAKSIFGSRKNETSKASESTYSVASGSAVTEAEGTQMPTAGPSQKHGDFSLKFPKISNKFKSSPYGRDKKQKLTPYEYESCTVKKNICFEDEFDRDRIDNMRGGRAIIGQDVSLKLLRSPFPVAINKCIAAMVGPSTVEDPYVTQTCLVKENIHFEDDTDSERDIVDKGRCTKREVAEQKVSKKLSNSPYPIAPMVLNPLHDPEQSSSDDKGLSGPGMCRKTRSMSTISGGQINEAYEQSSTETIADIPDKPNTSDKII